MSRVMVWWQDMMARCRAFVREKMAERGEANEGPAERSLQQSNGTTAAEEELVV